MQNDPKVSLSVLSQIPDFIRDEHPLFEEFLKSYYGSLERGSGPLNILNNLPDYFNLSKYDLKKINSTTNLIGSISATSRNIEVESTDRFPDENGTVLIDDEIIYYETLRKSPNVILTPDISYTEFNRKQITLFNFYQNLDGIRFEFDLSANNEPIFPPSSKHLIVKLYNEYLIPDEDYTVVGDKIRFTVPPRKFDPIELGDSADDINIKYLKGFSESSITKLDNIGVIDISIDEEKYAFPLKINGDDFTPTSLSLVVVIVDGQLLKPNVDYSVYESTILLKNYPTQSSYIGFINAPLLSVGSGFKGFSVVDNRGRIDKILVKDGGKNYTIDNTPKVSLVKGTGKNATAKALVSGVKSSKLLSGGLGYSKENPPYVVIQSPDNLDGSPARGSVVVNDQGNVVEFNIDYSGSGYDFSPRVQFVNPSGAKVGNVVVNQSGSIVSVDVLSGGIGYTVAPQIYIDDPLTPNGITALLQGNLSDEGTLESVTVLTGGTGYDEYNPPRVAVIEPSGAQVLSVNVDSFGRVVNIELLSGGFGYEDIPSVYIVDDRVDGLGNPIGGTGATAVATVFNGEIIDINITNFGDGYSITEPPRIYISSPSGAKASVEIGEGEITGFEIIEPGFEYTKSEFVGCSRGVSGISYYDSDENAVFVDETKSIATAHSGGSFVRGLDGIFLTQILDRIVRQYVPGIPKIDYDTVNIANVLRTVKDFYSSKGTSQGISYLFKVLYGVDIDISYPKDQIIKPSSASWSIDTILRAKLISGNPENLRDSSIIQEVDAVDPNIQYAEATVENFIAIQTSEYDVYELVLSEESIQGKFIIPYNTKLAEPMTPETSIITVDSTIGWPERNGEIIVGTELIRYKEKSLTQFIECTRGINETPSAWDSGTIITSNFYVKANSGTQNEVVLSVLGIVESNNTTLTDESSYYLPGDKLSISKLGSLDDSPLVTSWLYNVKKLIQVESITYGGIGDKTATVTCLNPHGLLVGDQVTVYGANPIVYNGSFLVSSRESNLVFKYELPQPATLNPQGNILISVDLNKGKSDEPSIDSSISNFATNIQNSFFNNSDVYIAASGIPNYKIGPFLGTSLLPGNQRKLYRFPRNPQTISLKPETTYGAIGSFINGISAWNYKSNEIYNYGPLTDVKIINPGSNYDADSPPVISFTGGGGSGASGSVIIDGSVVAVEVIDQGDGYETTPLVSISGGKGSGASATAIITNGKVTRILVNTQGSGYTSAPTITVTGGGGSGCTASAVVRGPIKEVVVDDYGNDYTSEPEVSLSSGEGAAAQAYVSNGRILSIAVISSGNGYTTAPKVTIVGEGYGAVAVANIQTEGSEIGKVTSITILNRGIGYKQGTTQIRLESVGEGAEFKTEIFKWTFNLQNNTNFDYANGSIFEGYNKQFGGEYGHVSNPKQLRYVLGDNLTVVNDQIVEKESGIVHSPIIGWAFDGNPIYGPYGLSDPTNLSSSVVPINSSYVLKENLVFNADTNVNPVRIDGPSLDEYPAGTFIEDYVYQFRSEQFYLDEYNGRFCKTPEYPEGTYAYFITLNSDGTPAFPYIIGPNFYSIPDSWNLSQFATQSNIPTGIVRYRAPFENVDIDVDRDPNESTNALTLENGDVLTFEVEDENRDGFIDEFEEADPDQIFEESKLELFDYFPKIDVSSKVDIEVETTTKFEDAKISGFLIENPGDNHQVGDRLVFDDTDTEGYGASGVVSEIVGKTITSYTYEYSAAQDEYFGVVQTSEPHNMVIGDIVNVTTTPLMEPTSKTIYVRTIQGLESVRVISPGLGYDPEIGVEAVIDSDTGIDAEVEPLISSTGSLNDIRIINSGRNYFQDPKIRITHPQVQKRSLYYALKRYYDSSVKILKSITDSSKNVYIVGSVKSSNGDTHAFISKINSEGTVIWSKSLTSIQPGSTKRAEFIDLVKSGFDIYVVGQTYPNAPSADSFNPDLLFAKYTENTSGTSVSLTWQKEAAGISGVLRKDYLTGIALVNNNLIFSGYTTTNATGTHDAMLMYISSGGDILHKRKVTSASESERFLGIKVDSNDNIYAVGQTTDNSLLVSKLRIVESKIATVWQKQIIYTGQEFLNISFDIDEYDELFITSTILNTATSIRNRIGLVKIDGSANILEQKEYTIPNVSTITAAICSIDVFSDLNIGYAATNSDGKKTSGIIKVNYKGNVINSYTLSGHEGYAITHALSDVSGDPYFVGTLQSNRTKFLYKGNDYSDYTGQYGNLVSSGTVSINTDPKWGTNAFTVGQNATLTTPTLSNTGNWTVESWIKWDSAATAKVAQIFRIFDSVSNEGIKVQLFADNSSPSTLGKWRLSNDAATTSQYSASVNNVTLISSGYYHIAVTKTYNTDTSLATYTLYFNGTQQAQITLSTNVNPTTISLGSTTTYNSWPTKFDSIRYSNYAIAYASVPSADFGGYDYGTENGYVMKFDKNADAERMGNIVLTNNGITTIRTSQSITPSTLELVREDYILGADGLQVLDFNDTTSYLTQDYHLPLHTFDSWSTRTATIPSPGGRKAVFETNAFGKYFFRHFVIDKFDNVRELQINQSFDFNIGTRINQINSIGATVGSARIVDIDNTNDILYVTDVSGTLSTNSGYLESSDLRINEIEDYAFAYVDASSPGTFDISIPSEVEATFKTYSDEDYLIRIDEIIAGAAYARGSVITLGSEYFSFTSDRRSVTITGLSSVTQITLISNLTKTLQIDSISNTNQIFARSTTSHYLSVGDNIYTETAPEYPYVDGSFYVSEVLSKKEILFNINSVPGAFIGSGTQLYVYVKHPVFKFIYGQQYTFDVTHVSNEGYYLSFYKDNLNKIEYTFKNIVRKGIPGRDAPGASPFISFKVTDDVSNISYYADPARIGEESPVSSLSYIDVVKSPYIGKFEIIETFGGSVTVGDNKFKFKIDIDPEANAQSSLSSYSTQSSKVAGPIANIRLVNGGGFYKKLPVITDIQSVRKIERVEIRSAGTEYAPGEYFGVPILGDGAGGKVRLTVSENSDPAGQIVEVVVTDPGKGYTEAYIDVDAIDGILGPQLSGSGAVLDVIIPPKGTGSSIFVKGENIGKIKKLKNNNFGFNYTHDYTLRPEITFPVNLQLINTSILSSIKVTDPGTGYTTVPEVVITGGGGSGASAIAETRNGRISGILIKNAGFGYSTAPTIELKTSFTYVVNLDLGLFQMAYPHGINNGSEVTFTVEDLGEGTAFPLTSFGYIIPGQIYYAIAGELAGLEDDQLRIALTPQDAESGNYISFANAGNGRQILLTNSFGGAAEAIVETGRFLSGELVFQGDTLETATATGFVSDNDGWQIGPRVLKLINTTGTFSTGEKVSGVISKANGTIDNINAAKGVIEVDSITKTPGKFLDDIGKPNEIVQKIQDSYLYQSFSYNVKSPISIDQWKTTITENTHPTGFKIFGEIQISEDKKGLTDKVDFELTKSVNLVESSVVAHIDNFGLVEPVYKEFDNTQVLFRTKKLTSSEEILTSYVQKIDDIAYLFDGERTSFPLTIDGSTVIANTNQLQININGVAQAPGTAFQVQQGSIVFSEPPPAPTKISYAVLTLQFLQSYVIDISNVSGILPELGQTIRGLVSGVSATVIESTTSTITVFNLSGDFQVGELLLGSATGLSAQFDGITDIVNDNIFEFKESITNTNKKTAEVEEINLNTANNVVTNQIVISKTSGTYNSPAGLLAIGINDYIISAKTRVLAKVIGVSPYIDPETGAPISSLQISDPSTFFGLLYNRIISPEYPNVIIDDISKSSIEVVDLSDSDLKIEGRIPEFETINNVTSEYTISSGPGLSEEEFVQNIKINYINSTGDFTLGETVSVNRLAYKGLTGGNFQAGDIVSNGSGYTASIIGVSYALKYLFLGQQTGSFTIGDTLSCDRSFVSNDDIVAGRNADASDLILANKLLIADIAVGRMLTAFPGFTVPGGNQNCKDDIVDILDEICFNLKYGGNHRAYDVGQLYIDNAYLQDERDESVYAINQARDMAIQAMRNEEITIGGYSTLTQYFDYTVEGDQSGEEGVYIPGDCADVASSITTLFGIVTQAIGSDATPGNLTGITRTNIGTVSCEISAYIETPFDVEQVNGTTDSITTYQYFDDTHHRFRDAANLLRLNSTYIIEEAVGRMKNRYPDLVIPGDETGGVDGTSRCKLDLSLLLNAVIEDIEYGGNYETLAAGRFYLDENGGLRFITRQVLQSVYAHQQMSLLCQEAVQGILSETPQYTNEIPVLPLGVTIDPSPQNGIYCADVTSKIDTLWTLINDVITTTGDVYKDAANALWFNRDFISEESVGKTTSYFTYFLNGTQYKAFDYPNGATGETKCKRDLSDYIIPSVIADLLSGGDSSIIEAMTYYIDVNDVLHVKDELLPTVYALEQANILCQYAVDNWIITGTSTEYSPQFANPNLMYFDPTITVDDGTYGGQCAVVKSAIDTLFTKAISILLPTYQDTEYRSAAKLILFNKEYFKEEIAGAVSAQYPNFYFGGADATELSAYRTKCKRDIGYIVDAIVYDLLTNGNSAILFATQSYIDAATGTLISLQGELVQTLYAYTLLKTLMKDAIRETLQSPSPNVTFYAYDDPNIALTTQELSTIDTFLDDRMQILLGTLNNSNYIEVNQIIGYNSITIPTKNYPQRIDITGISGKLAAGNYIYGQTSGISGEIESIFTNRATLKKILKRVRITFDNLLELFDVNDIITVQGSPTNTGSVYSYSYEENFYYIDIDVTSGAFSPSDILINGDGYTATVVSVTDKLQISKLVGDFANGDKIKEFGTNTEITISNYSNVNCPVIDNSGSKLTLETESYFGNFDETSVIYSNTSDIYIDVDYYQGTQVGLGDLVLTKKIYKLDVLLNDPGTVTFPVGSQLQDSALLTTVGTIVAFIPNDPESPTSAEIYVGNLESDFFTNGSTVNCYEPGNNFPIGIASVTSAVEITSEAYGFIEKIDLIGTGYRLYLSSVKGTFNSYAQLLGRFGYKSIITNTQLIVGRVSRSFRGFDGVQDSFKLTINNGTPYLPNPDGHLLVFLNGVLQPPEQSYSAFSDVIEFTEPPELGASFHSVYIGKLRKLDDIGFEFDSLRNSFNLKLDEVFYSLTVTSGSESSNIKPENNIIVSLNGIIQEPGVAFELVGSRLIFAEIPRAGSSFVAFSYIGSDADVIASEVVPPIETGDELEIEGEDQDRTVAIIESSNSLVTFDYTGSVFGRNAAALVTLIRGRISELSVTSSGNGYTSRPSVSIDSTTGFDGQIKALVGVSRVDVVDSGSGYAYPEIEIINDVSDTPALLIFDTTGTSFDTEDITFDQA